MNEPSVFDVEHELADEVNRENLVSSSSAFSMKRWRVHGRLLDFLILNQLFVVIYSQALHE